MRLMARRPKRKYKRRSTFSGYIKGNIDIDLDLGTLAAKTGLLAPTNTVLEKRRVSSIKCMYTMSGRTISDNVGPAMVLVAHSDYTLSEIEAWIEQTSSWDEGNLVGQEISNRRIRKIGTFPGSRNNTEASPLNDGKPIRTKLNWVLTTGQGLNFVAYNLGTAPYATTDPNMNVQGQANLFPQK